MDSGDLQADAAHIPYGAMGRFGPMNLPMEAELQRSVAVWRGLMRTAQTRFERWGRPEDDAAWHYCSERARLIDTLIRETETPAATHGTGRPEAGHDGHASDCATHDAPAYEPGPCNCSFATTAALRAISQGDVLADWQAFVRGKFRGDENVCDGLGAFPDLHTGDMADPQYRVKADPDAWMIRPLFWGCVVAGLLSLTLYL